MPEIYNKKFFLKTGYKITDEPIHSYGREIERYLRWSHSLGKQRKVSQADIRKLERLIEKHPEVIAFRNHLVVCHSVNGNHKMVREMTFKMLENLPDYDFAKFGVVETLIKEKDYDGASKILGETRKVEGFFKDEIIHVSAFRAFQILAAEIDTEEGKLDSAEERLNLVEELEPNKKDLIKKYRYPIILKRLEDSMAQRADAEKMRREVTSFPTVVFEETDEAVTLHHSTELSSFYDTDWGELPDNFEQILALPRESLIQDLENILIDSIQRSAFFEEEEDESLTSFPLHAIHFLGYLESENSLDTILNIFRQGDDFLDLWYNEFTKDLFLPVLFKVAKTKKEWHKLAQFLLEENVHSEPKSIVTDVLKELILAEKMPREQGLSLFQSTIEYVFKNIGNDDFLDTMFISSMISDIVDARLVELLPLLKQLYDNNLVDKVWAGKYEFVEKEIEKEIQDYDVKVQPTTLEEFYQPPKQKSNPEFREIMERAMNDPMFDAINSIFSDKIFYEDEDEDEKPVRLASPRNETFIQNEKIGRNDVCPCGSGKKYKKCHGKN